MVNEVWKDVKGYEGYYRVSNFGSVKSVDRIIFVVDGKRRYNKRLKGKILHQLKHGSGYRNVTLVSNGIERTVYVHRLVAEAFIPNVLNKPMVNHINSIKSDNKSENLEWCTNAENIQYAYDFENHRNAKKVICITDGKIFNSTNEAGRYYKANHNNISACCRNERKTCVGRKFAYYTDYCSFGERSGENGR
jgi:hypothetical protein